MAYLLLPAAPNLRFEMAFMVFLTTRVTKVFHKGHKASLSFVYKFNYAYNYCMFSF